MTPSQAKILMIPLGLGLLALAVGWTAQGYALVAMAGVLAALPEVDRRIAARRAPDPEREIRAKIRIGDLTLAQWKILLVPYTLGLLALAVGFMAEGYGLVAMAAAMWGLERLQMRTRARGV